MSRRSENILYIHVANSGSADHSIRCIGIISSNAKLFYGAFLSGHTPLFVESSTANCVCWNYDEVLDVIHSFPQCTAAYLCGHDHDGGQAIDAHGVLHITVQGVIETPPGGRAFATVHVHCDKIVVDGGGGRVISAVINL